MKAVKEKEQLQKIVDSWKDSSKNLWKLVDSGMSSTSRVGLGYDIKSNDEVLSYEEEMNRTVFNCTEEDFIDKPLYSRFTKTNNFKGVLHPLSGDYTPKPQQEIDESLYVYGKKGPQKPEISDSDDTSNEHSTCQSNDSKGSFGNPSKHSSESESESISVPNEMFTSKSITTNEKDMSESKEVEPSCVTHVKTPRQQIHKVKGKNWNEIMERELGEGYSFIKKKCFVCGSLSHLIRDCDFYEKKMAREAELKKQMVFNTGNRVAKPVWNNANRVNRVNHFIPKPVQLNNVRQNVNSVRPNVNTGRANVNYVKSNVNSIRPNVNTGRANVNFVKSNVNSIRPNVNTGRANVNFVRSNVNFVRHNVNSDRTNVNTGRSKQPGTAIKTSAGYNWRRTRPNSNYNSGSNFVRTDHPLKNMEDRGIFDSGCSRHMTGNKDHLDDFEECKGGSVTFGGSKVYITDKGRIRHKVLFTETECLAVSPDFKMPDENQILLKVPRQHNMYSFDMKTPSLTKDYACLIAKATSDESKLWHRRLGHINFKNLNKLVKGNLVRGLPSKVFRNDHTCVACHKDNGTEFKNRDMLAFCKNKGIKQEYSNARTPQQNGVAERMNRTLIEAARTMLADSLLPTTFWAEVVNTACYIFNWVRVTKPQNKTPYELLFGHKPIISYIRPFGCHVTILDNLSGLGKFDGKCDEGFLVGYSLNSKAFRVYNLVTKKVEVNLHVKFLEEKPNVKGVGTSEVTNSAGTLPTPNANAYEGEDKAAELIVVPTAVKHTAEKVGLRMSSTNSKAEEELDELAQNNLREVPKNKATSTNSVSTGSGPVSSARGQREGKAPMIVEETQAPKRTKEQIQQEEASLAEAIRLQTLEEEETAKQVHLDALLTKRMEEEELTEQHKAKLEANAELTKNVLGKELPEEDFAKKMVELVNQRKKFFAEERAKARRSKPMTQSQLRNYMMNYLKNQGTWKLTQLKKLSFEEVKEEFEKLVKQTEISKKQRIDDKDVSVEEKVTEVKEEEPIIRTGKRKKQNARKGINVDKSPQGDSETGERSIYQIIRANGADTVYMSFGAMLKDFTREDLIELYRLVMQKYGTNRPEDVYDRVLWSDLRTMFDPPLNEDAIWSLPLQQKIISWRYYDKCEVHCLTLEACSIYMLADRKYPLSKDACQVMLKMKLLDGKMNEVCYKLLKMIEKQAGEAHNEDIQRNLKFTSEDQVRGGLLGIIVNRLKSGSYRVKSKTLDLHDVYFDIEPDTGVFTKVVDDISDNSTRELYVHVPNVFPTLSSENDDKVFNPGILASNEEKSPHLLSHRGFKAFQVISDFSESPMMIYGEDIPILDVPFLYFYPP
ncbi:ribonuclease H-like domain-containing protein [Tanacetum coccineum]